MCTVALLNDAEVKIHTDFIIYQSFCFTFIHKIIILVEIFEKIKKMQNESKIYM